MRLDPNLALSHAHLGLILQHEGQARRCAAVAEAGRRSWSPATRPFWGYLADCYDEMEEPAAVVPCWERVLALAPDRAGAHVALGWALQEEGRLAEAGEHYRTAPRCSPTWPWPS